MKLEHSLSEGTILKRYKRFLADIKLGEEFLTCHVPNTGSMTSCWAENWKCAVSHSSNPKRKMPYTLELTHNGKSWIGVNTLNANRIVAEALEKNLISEFDGYQNITSEYKIGDSRIDFFLSNHTSQTDCFVEVKSVSLVRENVAQFPDAVSTRGQKHLEELIKLKDLGFRTCMLFIVQRQDAEYFTPAHDIDKKYAKLLSTAYNSGVEILCYDSVLNPTEFKLGRNLPIRLN